MLQKAKLLAKPEKYALALMSHLLVNGNLTGVSKSSDEKRKNTIKQLDLNRVDYIKHKNSYNTVI